jgi:hypothetical protein
MTAANDDAETARVTRVLLNELATLCTCPDCATARAEIRCALSLLSGASTEEICPKTGLAYTVDEFARITPNWARAYKKESERSGANRTARLHQLVLRGRRAQADYARFHPELAEPQWFADHGPRVCEHCRADHNV